MTARCPYLAVASARGDSALMPLRPIELRLGAGEPARTCGLVDSGAAVNVLPFELGRRLGALWDAQKTRVTLTGNLAASEARALLVEAQVADFAPVRLVFAWSRADNLTVILGQVNFFEEFEVRFRGAQRHFEIEPVRR